MVMAIFKFVLIDQIIIAGLLKDIIENLISSKEYDRKCFFHLTILPLDL
jgi:hypothetical protein